MKKKILMFMVDQIISVMEKNKAGEIGSAGLLKERCNFK